MARLITLRDAAWRLERFNFLIDNMVLNAMTLTLVRAQKVAVTVYMLPKSLTSPVDPNKLTRRTERLAKSVRVDRPRVFGNRFFGALLAGGANAPYAAIHERGGTINHPGSVAKAGKVLAFTPRGGGEMIFRTRTAPHKITIPARPYLNPGVRDSLAYLGDQLAAGCARIRTEVGL